MEVRREYVDGWIPNSSNKATNAEVRKRLGWVSESYDVIHGFGYRMGTAISDLNPKARKISSVITPLPNIVSPASLANLDAVIVPSSRISLSFDGEIAKRLNVATPGFHSRCSDSFELKERYKIGTSRYVVSPIESKDSLIAELIRRESVKLASRSPDVKWVLVGPQADQLAVGGNCFALPPSVKLEEVLPGASLMTLLEGPHDYSIFAVQAMAYGVPVILPGSRNEDMIIDHRHSGFVYESWDQLGDVVADAMQLELMRESMAQCAVATSHHQHEPSQMLEAILAAYGEM